MQVHDKSRTLVTSMCLFCRNFVYYRFLMKVALFLVSDDIWLSDINSMWWSRCACPYRLILTSSAHADWPLTANICMVLLFSWLNLLCCSHGRKCWRIRALWAIEGTWCVNTQFPQPCVGKLRGMLFTGSQLPQQKKLCSPVVVASLMLLYLLVSLAAFPSLSLFSIPLWYFFHFSNYCCSNSYCFLENSNKGIWWRFILPCTSALCLCLLALMVGWRGEGTELQDAWLLRQAKWLSGNISNKQTAAFSLRHLQWIRVLLSDP
jgi:hypothetical protein